MATLTGSGAVALNTDQLNLAKILTGTVAVADAGHIRFTYSDGTADDLFGAFTYTGAALTGGTLTRATETTSAGANAFDVTGFSLPVTDFLTFVRAGDNTGILTAVFAGADTLRGAAGNDTLRGFAGDDTFFASGGTDVIDGGAGADVLVLNGSFANYTVTSLGAGAWTLVDTRTGSPDGAISTSGMEALLFADGRLSTTPVPRAATVATLEVAFANVTRFAPTSPDAQATTLTLADGSVVSNAVNTQRNAVLNLAADLDFARVTQAAALSTLAHYGDATTSVATLSYQFFTGKTPSTAGYDYLVHSAGNANDLNDAYYAKFNIENRYINFAVNLGKLGEGQAAFSAAYSSLTLTQSLQKAYAVIFGTAADDAKAAAILNASVVFNGVTATRADYFAYYGADGANGIGTKAAMVGFLMVEAVKADTGTYALANDRFLLALENGTASYNVDLVGAYGAATSPASHDPHQG